MRNGKTRPEYSIIKVRVLILIYSLLCILTILFSRNFFIDVLQNGEVPGRLNLIVFFTIPAVLMIVLGISVFSLVTDFITRRPGSKFNARLLAYFTIIVVFSATPATLMTGTALNEIIRFWQSIDAVSTIKAANSFVADNYSMHIERFENILKQNDFSRVYTKLPNDIKAMQTVIDGIDVIYPYSGLYHLDEAIERYRELPAHTVTEVEFLRSAGEFSAGKIFEIVKRNNDDYYNNYNKLHKYNLLEPENQEKLLDLILDKIASDFSVTRRDVV